METEVNLTRNLFDYEIRQKSKSEYFCASDLVNAGNRWRITNGMKVFNYSQWLKNPSTVEFIKTIENECGKKAIIKGVQKNSLSWIHPYLFIDLALAISPALKIETYKWLFDHLCKYRNQSGDSYKKMSGALYLTTKNKSNFQKEIQDFANKIKNICEVDDWQHATEEQLKLRDKIHENVAILADIIPNRELLLNTATKKAIENK